MLSWCRDHVPIFRGLRVLEIFAGNERHLKRCMINPMPFPKFHCALIVHLACPARCRHLSCWASSRSLPFLCLPTPVSQVVILARPSSLLRFSLDSIVCIRFFETVTTMQACRLPSPVLSCAVEDFPIELGQARVVNLIKNGIHI